MKVKFIFDEKKEVLAEFYETACAQGIYEILPVEAKVNIWGEEYYFSIPFDFPLDETATLKVKVGDIGYWPPGKALAIFFGKTPLSVDENPIPASEVNLIGKLLDPPEVLKTLSPKKVKVVRS
ncbi:MAG: cyclophilin-like fold protein [Thermodesulfobacteriaceae bacterium]|nr:cyclophilin-like fold protein [Thermodesulfobacteriaceae bacterium]MCX8042361.1 cyclophilin-like fold protein [Thermodesulfobacteriaceae bacterium]MDW8136669.1 cyclophilin-like fold protein [Thermodesulfobacterium sp.]